MRTIDKTALINIENLAAVASPGPWLTTDEAERWDTPNQCGYDSRAADRGAPYYATGVRVGSVAQAEIDARFIAASRSDVPALCAAVRERDERIAILSAAVRDGVDALLAAKEGERTATAKNDFLLKAIDAALDGLADSEGSAAEDVAIGLAIAVTAVPS